MLYIFPVNVQKVQAVQSLRSVQAPSLILPHVRGGEKTITTPPKGRWEGINDLNGLNVLNYLNELTILVLSPSSPAPIAREKTDQGAR